jgi:uncharacterized integral membrane protein
VRYVSGFLTFLLVAILVLFASSNKEETKLELFPLPQEITAPLYLIAFLLIFAGFVLGGLAAWNAGRRHRRNAKQSNKRVQILEGDLVAMRNRAEAAEERAAQLVSASRTETPQFENPELI